MSRAPRGTPERIRGLLSDRRQPATAGTVIVGGGIAGLATALELARLGHEDIVIVESGYPGSGATGRNVARIRAMQLSEELCRIAAAAQAKYDAMGEDLAFNILFYRMGYAWILYDPDEVERMRAIVEMHHRVGVRSVLLDGAGVLDAVPVFRGGEPVAAGVVHDDAIVHHDAVVWAHLEALAATGVRLLARTAVTGVARDDRGVSGVVTDRGPIETRNVVNATDAWSSGLSALARVTVPNRPYRREVLVTAPVQRLIDKAITFYRPHEGWFNQTLRGEVVMGAVDEAEPAGIDQRSSAAFLRRTAALMISKAPALGELAVIRQWAGMYDVTPDHLPLVGPTAQLPGWWQMNGWSGRGMLLAPYAAELLARRMSVAGATATGALAGEGIPALFDPDRFAVDAAAADTQDPDYYRRYAAAATH
jgi:sarcosine oxidase subunit beta